ncbi:MAG: PD-(D/E)XK nuclease family protein [Lachnospiraceae bacterium]|nr:PD-(D/E)XK nuclease family protein [Lachnospiraceae bacterium]
MGEISYKPLVEDMTWSYSRIECFNDCPYRFFLKYIRHCDEKPQFYSSYGSFMHKLLEQYYRGELTKEEMQTKFLFDFSKEVQGIRPQESTVRKYIEAGIEYLRGFNPLPFKMIDVEKEVRFEIGGRPFVGFIDYIGEKDGELYIVDNKSRDLKPRSGKAKQTAKDKELDEMLKQLYVYAAAVKQEYGRFPKYLCFNCFKTNTFIEEEFNENKFTETIEWITKSIEDIVDSADNEDFYPNVEFFGCYYICGVSDDCLFWEMR